MLTLGHFCKTNDAQLERYSLYKSELAAKEMRNWYSLCMESDCSVNIILRLSKIESRLG